MEISQFIAQDPNWYQDQDYQKIKGLIKGALTADGELNVDRLQEKLDMFGVDVKEVK